MKNIRMKEKKRLCQRWTDGAASAGFRFSPWFVRHRSLATFSTSLAAVGCSSFVINDWPVLLWETETLRVCWLSGRMVRISPSSCPRRCEYRLLTWCVLLTDQTENKRVPYSYKLLRTSTQMPRAINPFVANWPKHTRVLNGAPAATPPTSIVLRSNAQTVHIYFCHAL